MRLGLLTMSAAGGLIGAAILWRLSAAWRVEPSYRGLPASAWLQKYEGRYVAKFVPMSRPPPPFELEHASLAQSFSMSFGSPASVDVVGSSSSARSTSSPLAAPKPALSELPENQKTVVELSEPFVAFQTMGKPALPMLLRALKRPEPAICTQAAYVLGDAGCAAPEVLAALVKLIRTTERASHRFYRYAMFKTPRFLSSRLSRPVEPRYYLLDFPSDPTSELNTNSFWTTDYGSPPLRRWTVPTRGAP